MGRPITFLSDFGLTDCYVGICHAVMSGIAPDVRVIDLLHTVPALDVRRGATALADCVRAAPPAVHLAVVDPDQTTRPGVALVAHEAVLVGPDNGMLLPAAQVLGGVTAAVRLDDARFHRTPVSPVFRARDVFAPVAAAIAAGADPTTMGTSIAATALQRLALADPHITHKCITAKVRNVDHYGNIQLPVTHADLVRAQLDGGRPVRFSTGDDATTEIRRVASFSDLAVGELGIVEDSLGWLAVVAGGQDASSRLGLAPADDVRLGDD